MRRWMRRCFAETGVLKSGAYLEYIHGLDEIVYLHRLHRVHRYTEGPSGSHVLARPESRAGLLQLFYTPSPCNVQAARHRRTVCAPHPCSVVAPVSRDAYGLSTRRPCRRSLSAVMAFPCSLRPSRGLRALRPARPTAPQRTPDLRPNRMSAHRKGGSHGRIPPQRGIRRRGKIERCDAQWTGRPCAMRGRTRCGWGNAIRA